MSHRSEVPLEVVIPPFKYHVVKPGDSIFQIARLEKVSWLSIYQWTMLERTDFRGRNPNVLKVGEILWVPLVDVLPPVFDSFGWYRELFVLTGSWTYWQLMMQRMDEEIDAKVEESSGR